MLQALPVPTTYAGFKNHPKYVLEKFLHTDQAIHPTHKTAGIQSLFKGEAVYLLSHVECLGTVSQWRSQMKGVKEGETPCKTVIRKRGEATIEVKFYGSWQTEPYKVGLF